MSKTARYFHRDDFPDEVVGRLLRRAKIEMEGCWLAGGEPTGAGYGQLCFGIDGQSYNIMAHELAYILEYGQIPVGVHLHHECGVKKCWRFDHITALTPDQHRNAHKLNDRHVNELLEDLDRKE